MSYTVHVRRQIPAGFALSRVAAAGSAALALARAGAGEMTVVLTDSRCLRRLNARYAGEDRVTDVLAFPADVPRQAGRRYFGDVVIALPRARLQARRRGVPLSHEVSLLTVHGTLHLLGHDHARPAERRRMWRLQASALRRLGLDPQQLGVL